MIQKNCKFKVLIYGEYFLPVVGGVQTSMNLLAKGLVELNNGQDETGDPQQFEATIVTMSAADGMDDSIFPYRVIRRPRFWRLAKLIHDADVVHIAGPCLLPMAIAWLIGKPVVIEHHGYQAICHNGLLFREPSKTVCPGHFGQRKYGKCVHCASETMGLVGAIRTLVLTFPRAWLCKRVAANIAISDHVAVRLKLPRTRTVYYGIEESPNVRAEISSSPRNLVHVAYVGRLVTEKGPALLLEAAKYLADDGICFRLSFIGDGPERARLEKLASGLHLSSLSRFTGDLRGSQLEEAVAKVDLVVMPSLCEETAGLSAIEQMMRGRVVIVADIGGLGEVVGEAGLKFAPADSQALAACIRKVIDDPTLAVSLGSMALERATRLFKLGSMIKGHVSIYREICPSEMQKRDSDSVQRSPRSRSHDDV
jgi:glycosyltransferase involved in cell wall biosynthesis